MFKIPHLKCKRCNHEWIPRKNIISICPKCKSKLWNNDKK